MYDEKKLVKGVPGFFLEIVTWSSKALLPQGFVHGSITRTGTAVPCMHTLGCGCNEVSDTGL